MFPLRQSRWLAIIGGLLVIAVLLWQERCLGEVLAAGIDEGEEGLTESPKPKHVRMKLKKPVMTPENLRASKPVAAKFRSAAPGNNSDVTVILKNNENFSYYAQIQIGSPRQYINVQIDTGSSNLWVLGFKYGDHRYYKNTRSYSYKKNGMKMVFNYGGGAASGYLSQDKVDFGDGIILKDYTFTEVKRLSLRGFATSPLDGILGLAWEPMFRGPGSPIFQSLLKKNLIPAAQFSLYLADQTEGELILGGSDPTLYNGTLQEIPLQGTDWWRIEVKAFKFNKTTTTGISAIIDSGSSYILMPPTVFDGFISQIPAKEVNGLHTIDCGVLDTLPNMVFNIRGVIYTLTSNEYTVNWRGTCYVAVSSIDMNGPDGPIWILGDSFMRPYYTIFDFERRSVSLAKIAACGILLQK